MNQWNRVESPEINPHTYIQRICNKGGKNIQWRKDSLFTKWCWESWTASCKSIKLEHTITPYTKINKWDIIKRTGFCTARETINRIKRQLMDWEKIFANDATNKGLTIKIYKLLTTQLQKNKQPNQKMGRRTKQTFLPRRH